jgi:ABC-type oligopeptide transport system substrate-binding subunit
MDRTKLACFSLLASAFVLAALLIVRLPGILPKAQATMVDDQDRFAVMTVQTRNNQESLFVIDQVNEKLLVYDVNGSKAGPGQAGALDLVYGADLRSIFNGGGPGGGLRPH